jgi:hypothetical protein
MPASQACATEATDLLGDGSTCCYAQTDEVMSAAPCARSASEANLTRRLDHHERVVAMASAAPRTIQATQ